MSQHCNNRGMKPVVLMFAALFLAPASARAEPPATMFGGQLVRPTTLAGAVAIEVGGGGALYATNRLYWGGGGGTVFQVAGVEPDRELEMFHGELMLGFDLVQRPRLLVSALALAGAGMTRQHSGVFAMTEARAAVRTPLASWFMLGAHLGYRRAIASDMPAVSDGDLSGPVLGLELYFVR